MEYRKLGRAGIDVSVLSLGSWKTFEFMERDRSLAVLKTALEAGINFLDDARYDDTTGRAPIPTGYSEVVFGELLRASGRKRADLVIANKLWFEFYPGESFEAELDGSLGRIAIDYVDLIYGVTPPPAIQAATLVEGMAGLIAAGKARHWGLANCTAEFIGQCCALAKATGAPLPSALQLPYSILKRSPAEDRAMSAVCAEYEIGIVASFSLEGGILTGKYNREGFPATVRGRAEEVARLKAEGVLEKVDQCMDAADALGCTPAQLALAYCLKNPQTSSVLFGATSPEQVLEDIDAVGAAGRLDSTTLSRLQNL